MDDIQYVPSVDPAYGHQGDLVADLPPYVEYGVETQGLCGIRFGGCGEYGAYSYVVRTAV